MSKTLLIIASFLFAEIFFSCKKITVEQNTGDAQWIKVISDSPVYFPGKIRSDAENNLFCSYSYMDYKIDTNSAIIKLDRNGNLLCKKEFVSLAIYDFVVTGEGDAVIASYANGMITLTTVSPTCSAVLLGSYPLPLMPGTIRDIAGMKIFITSAGNYNISGTVFYRLGDERVSMAFMMEVSKTGTKIWMQDYFFHDKESATTITGCAPAGDGYILFGNVQYKDPAVSSFFILRCDEQGDSLWTKFYVTSSFTSTGPDSGSYHGYYCNTSDIIPSGDENFYACAFNEKYNMPNVNNLPIYTEDDNSARIMKINADGEIVDYVRLKYEFQNMAAALVRTNDNGLLIGFNPINLVGTYYVGKQSSFVARLTADLCIQSVSHIQTQYYDYLGSICSIPDGHFAIASMIQSFGKENYHLQIIKTNENGNF